MAAMAREKLKMLMSPTVLGVSFDFPFPGRSKRARAMLFSSFSRFRLHSLRFEIPEGARAQFARNTREPRSPRCATSAARAQRTLEPGVAFAALRLFFLFSFGTHRCRESRCAISARSASAARSREAIRERSQRTWFVSAEHSTG